MKFGSSFRTSKGVNPFSVLPRQLEVHDDAVAPRQRIHALPELIEGEYRDSRAVGQLAVQHVAGLLGSDLGGAAARETLRIPAVHVRVQASLEALGRSEYAAAVNRHHDRVALGLVTTHSSEFAVNQVFQTRLS